MLSLELLHFVGGGIANVVHGVMVLLFEELIFEGKDREEIVVIAPNVLDLRICFMTSPF